MSISVDTNKINGQIKSLNKLKTIEKTIKMNSKSKGETEKEIIKAKVTLEEIDKTMDILIDSTIDLITQTKSLYEQYTDDYVNRFARE